MSSAAAGNSAGRIPVWLTQGFRPFFLAAALWGAFALALWIAVLTQGLALPSRFDPLTWHIHEMLFGFVMAAVGGFLLTAVPNWTGRPFVGGPFLASLAGLWLLGRVVCLISAALPFWITVAADLAFPIALMAVSARELLAGGKRRCLLMLAPVGVMTAANLLLHLKAVGAAVPPELGWRLGLAAILVLVSVIAGRIIPTFTRNWLIKHDVQGLPAPPGAVDRVALGTLHAGLVAWAFLPDMPAVGWLLLAAGLFNAWRLWRWRGLSMAEEPLLLILHVGYGWLTLGAVLLGLAAMGLQVPQSAAIHALTVGAMGTMILAVMTRAARGHTGRALSADCVTILIYMLISAAALLRIVAAIVTGQTMPLLVASGAFWIAAFLIFAVHYSRVLLGPRAN